MSENPWPNVTVIRHPVVQERLTQARDRHTVPADFRRLVRQMSYLMAFELTRDLPTDSVEVRTPLTTCRGEILSDALTLVPVLRAGIGMLEGILELFPTARVGYLGAYRDERKLEPVIYYRKFPPDIARTQVIVVDPMLATAGSVSAALDAIKEAGTRKIRVLCLLAAPEGLDALQQRHGDVPLFTAAVDDHLNEDGFIVPGLGDAGDRLFATR